MDAKMQILEDTFQNRFSIESYLRFSREFFGSIRIVHPEKENDSIPTEYRHAVASYWHLATYTVDKNTLDIFAVKLNAGRSFERARGMQRSFVSKLLSHSNHDGAIVAFFTENDPRWRLSFLRIDYVYARGRGENILLPAKRYSYLVGEKEPCHTAMAQLYPIFRDDNFNPSLDRIEEAFSVERVTQEFFDQYKEKYFILKEYLDNSPVFCEEAQRHSFTSEQFAKKLMGQLAFLYFLQKKGWLGEKGLPESLSEQEYQNAFSKDIVTGEIINKIYTVCKNGNYELSIPASSALTDEEADIAIECFNLNGWGNGSKTFIRDFYEEYKDKSFYNDCLNPLFYEALNQRRGEHSYYKRFNYRIPFLNGGLFEPFIKDWAYRSFDIPNELFSNDTLRGKREADGILDIFDRYNFTMNEDEPLEREVAVDPEMLGKIFENLLDAKDRKSKGAFYTPREIVHYMCAESLINYLVSKTKLPYDDIRIFIHDGEFMKDEDYTRTEGERRLPQTVYNNLRQIDKALENIKVADPAVGSGAFSLGMLSEIVKARDNITYYYISMLSDKAERDRLFEQRNPYRLKWDTIQNCIFAVDIEASAVDIAKLRLWLSLVVDEDLSPSRDEAYLGISKQRDPRPLPNLDCNIMCGNSLVDEFDGIQLFDDSLLGKDSFDTKGSPSTIQMSIFMDSMNLFLDDLKHEQERLFGEQDPDTKRTIKKRIDKITDDIIRAKLTQDGNTEGLRRYNESQKQKTKPYFLWKLEFAKVFQENGGFDIVIGNPPYVSYYSKQAQTDETTKDKLTQLVRIYDFIQNKRKLGRYNLLMFFVERSIHLLTTNGVISLIVDTSIHSNPSYDIRKYLFNNVQIHQFVDEFAAFQQAASSQMIFIGTKKEPDKKETILWRTIIGHDFKTVAEAETQNVQDRNYSFKAPITDAKDTIIKKLKARKTIIDFIGKSNVRTCITFTGQKERFVCDAPKAKTDYPLLEGSKSVPSPYCPTFYTKYIHYDLELRDKLNEEYRQKAIQENKRTPMVIGLGDLEMFSSPKIFVRLSDTRLTGTYCSLQACADLSLYIIALPNREIEYEGISLFAILGVLNSQLMTFYYRVNGMIKNLTTGTPQIRLAELRALPIPDIFFKSQSNIVDIVKRILLLKHTDPATDTSLLEKQIDRLVYDLYGLSDNEIRIVEESVK